MVKIKINRDFWLNGTKKVIMYHEECSNPVCDARPLHYPEYLLAPYCPECKTDLLGIVLKSSDGRVAYHLEA